MKKIIVKIFIFLCVSLVGCSFILRHSIDDHVNSRFPPIDYGQIKREAIEHSRAELRLMQSPALLLNVPKKSLDEGFVKALSDFKSEEVQIISARIFPEEQGLRFVTEIEGKFNSPKGKFQATIEGGE